MTARQRYIILIIITTSVIVFFKKDIKTNELPNSIGDPLELIIVQKSSQFSNEFHKTVKQYLTTSIGPAPQDENLLSVTELESKKFTGIFKRHQNLLFINKSEKFNISIKKNVFANDQIVVVLECPSLDALKDHENQIKSIVETIKQLEINRLINGFKSNVDKGLKNLIQSTHGISIFPPKGFFLAHQDTNITWIRRETPKISQGVFVANLFKTHQEFDSINRIITIIDSLIYPHISGPLDGSYMICDKTAPLKIDTIQFKNGESIKLQSLWKMENDFMGGIYVGHIYNLSSPVLIYTYLYAPGEKKNIPLLQLEALISTTHKLK